MRTIGELIEVIRASGVALSLTPEDRLRYAGPALSDLDVATLRANRDAVISIMTLERRLDLGWNRCEAEKDPQRKAQLETFWIQLLNEYEAACGQVAEQQEGAAA
jgi:hypothetical protein